MACRIFYDCIMEKLYPNLSKRLILNKFKDAVCFMFFYPKERKLIQKYTKLTQKRDLKGIFNVLKWYCVKSVFYYKNL